MGAPEALRIGVECSAMYSGDAGSVPRQVVSREN